MAIFDITNEWRWIVGRFLYRRVYKFITRARIKLDFTQHEAKNVLTWIKKYGDMRKYFFILRTAPKGCVRAHVFQGFIREY